MEGNINADFYRLLHELQAVDFKLVELSLFLDTHPDDRPALEEFNQQALIRKDLACEYERNYGPLLQFGRSFSQYPWQWIETPWPWQV